LTRRHFLSSLASAAFLGGLCTATRDTFASSTESAKRLAAIEARLSDLEFKAQGRLGVHILDTATGQEYGYRSDERFMMLSSFKLLASALVLHRVDTGRESLERRIHYSKEDLVTWSPVTEKHADGAGMTLAQLCDATIITSDNTAANLILSSYGGPTALTAYARQLGDAVTRFDRYEPYLNVIHGELDTTSPRAMVGTMQKVVLGNALYTQSRNLLQQWLLSNTTGGQRLQAGLPKDWRVGDKTGTNQTDSNDIGVIWPPKRAPILVAAYLAESQASSQTKDATIAAVGKLVRDNVV
jgi:beta-lactamase class A